MRAGSRWRRNLRRTRGKEISSVAERGRWMKRERAASVNFKPLANVWYWAALDDDFVGRRLGPSSQFDVATMEIRNVTAGHAGKPSPTPARRCTVVGSFAQPLNLTTPSVSTL
jgi:hypothetical protein